MFNKLMLVLMALLVIGQSTFAVEPTISCHEALDQSQVTEGDVSFSREVKTLIFNNDTIGLLNLLHSLPKNKKLSATQKKYKVRALVRVAESHSQLTALQRQTFYKDALDIIGSLSASMDPGIMYLKARAQFATGQNLAAIETVEQMIHLKVADGRALMIKAKALSILNRSGESLVVLDQQLKLEPTSLFLLTYKAQILFGQNQLQEALRVLEQTLNYYPHDFVALAIKAKIQVRLGDYQSAIEIAQFLLNRDPHSIKTKQVAGAILLHAKIALGETDLSLKMVDDLILISPDNLSLLGIKFRLYLKLGYLDKAEDLAQSIYNKFKEVTLAKKYLVKIWLLTGKIEQASSFMNKNNLWVNPEMVHTVIEYFLVTHQPYQANRILNEQVSMHDRGARISYWRLASYYHQIGDNMRSVQILKRFLNKSPHVDLKILAAYLNIGGSEAQLLKPILMKSLNQPQQNFVNKVSVNLNWLELHSQVSIEEWQLEHEITPLSMKNLVWTGLYDQPIDAQALKMFRGDDL